MNQLVVHHGDMSGVECGVSLLEVEHEAVVEHDQQPWLRNYTGAVGDVTVPYVRICHSIPRLRRVVT